MPTWLKVPSSLRDVLDGSDHLPRAQGRMAIRTRSPAAKDREGDDAGKHQVEPGRVLLRR